MRRSSLGRTMTVVVATAMACGLAVVAGGCGADEAPGPASPSPSVIPGTTSASPVVVPYPSTAAGRQLAWVIGTMNEGKALSDAEITAGFSPAFLKQVPAAQLRAALKQVAAAGPLRLGAILQAAGDTTLVARLDSAQGVALKTTIVVEPSAAQQITGLLFQPYEEIAKPTSWEQVDERLAKLAAHASLLAVEVGDGAGDTQIRAREAERVGAIGSAFKLYVLGALAAAVSDGSAKWNERLAVRDAWKSLPSGEMRNEPAGRRFTLRHYAEQMISVSDNTATDHLLHRLGREAVEAQLAPMGLAEPAANTPFLTTRDMFALKLSAPDALRDEYVAAATQRRRQLLAQLAALPVDLDDVTGWTAPRDIDTVEWFASPADLVRAMEYLRTQAARPGLTPVTAILGINPGIALDSSAWRSAAFKGGSEPGVLCLVWLLERHDGRSFALAMVLNDAGHDIDAAEAVAVAEGAVDLLAGAP